MQSGPGYRSQDKRLQLTSKNYKAEMDKEPLREKLTSSIDGLKLLPVYGKPRIWRRT